MMMENIQVLLMSVAVSIRRLSICFTGTGENITLEGGIGDGAMDSVNICSKYYITIGRRIALIAI